jgi:pSer/pThr/pTyr-binding forkhead associated (FHA) protein
MPELHLTPMLLPETQHGAAVPDIALRRLPCVIGRSRACDLRLADPMISRRHCAFSLRDGQVWVEDLASHNGTRLDGERLRGPRPVATGAVLQLSRWTFTIRLEDASSPSRSHPALTRPRAGEAAM